MELEKMYKSLTLFSDLDWKAVNEEFETEYKDCSFPEYLQQKALEGDCPLYLFELAFYEYASHELKSLTATKGPEAGYHINPTNLFLTLEFDIPRMLKDSETGTIEIHEKPHVLCLYKDLKNQVHTCEVTEKQLKALELLELGPLTDQSQLSAETKDIFAQLIQKGLIFS